MGYEATQAPGQAATMLQGHPSGLQRCPQASDRVLPPTASTGLPGMNVDMAFQPWAWGLGEGTAPPMATAGQGFSTDNLTPSPVAKTPAFLCALNPTG